MRWLLSLTVVGALTASLPAQSADDKELMQYRLTAEVLAKAEAVAKAFDANVSKDPKMKKLLAAKRELAALDAKDNLTPAEQKRAHELSQDIGHEENDLGFDAGSLSEMSAQFQKNPAMAAALKSEGMLPRDLAKFVMASVNSALSGMPASPATAENARFLAANQAAIERIGKLLGAR